MVRERVTADVTARLRVRLANEGAERVVTVADAPRSHLYRQSRGRSAPDGLWLYRVQDHPSRSGTCWTEPTSPDHTRTFLDGGTEYTTLATGESVTTTYDIWDDYATAGYFPTGTYRFVTGIGYWTPGEDPDADNPTPSLEWWLELRVVAAGE